MVFQEGNESVIIQISFRKIYLSDLGIEKALISIIESKKT